MSVDRHDLDGGFGTRGRGGEGERVPRADIEDADEGEVEVGELEGKELGG